MYPRLDTPNVFTETIALPTIKFQGQSIECDDNANLRRVLLDAQSSGMSVSLYNGIARHIHCRGLGTCGTCAVRISGDVTPKTKIETWRLNFPPHKTPDSETTPHSSTGSLRLACQCQVIGDLELTKQDGLWGHKDSQSIHS